MFDLRSGTSISRQVLIYSNIEESGLWGARFVDKNDLGNPVMAHSLMNAVGMVEIK